MKAIHYGENIIRKTLFRSRAENGILLYLSPDNYFLYNLSRAISNLVRSPKSSIIYTISLITTFISSTKTKDLLIKCNIP